MFRTLSTAVLLLLVALPGVALAQGTGTLAGRVLEQAAGEVTLPGANVRIEGTSLGAATDAQGNYRIIGVPVGTYTVTASFSGFAPQSIVDVQISNGYTRQLDFTLQPSGALGAGVTVVYERPIIQNDAIGAPRVISGADLENLPIRGVAAVTALQGGVVNTEGSSDLNIRGGRAGEVQYFVDGVRVAGGSLLGVNQQSIQEQEVLIGTIPARYGDVQSGVISITTKTGRDRFFGSLEGVTSRGLDSFGYNLASISLGGPLVRERVGFFISAEGQNTADANPYGVSTFRLSDDAFEQLRQRPQVVQVRDAQGQTSFVPFPVDLVSGFSGGAVTRARLDSLLLASGAIPSGSSTVNGILVNAPETFTEDNFELRRGKNDPLRDLTVNGNLNFTFGDFGLRLGGGFSQRNRENYSFANSLYNRDRFNNDERQSYRVYGTFRQRISNSAFYQIQGEYSDFRSHFYPEGFSKNVADVLDYGDLDHPTNQLASRYYVLRGGQYESLFVEDGGQRPGSVAPGTFSLPGRTNLSTFQKRRNEQVRFSGSATTQLGVNQIEFGGEFQQETRRLFQINGFQLARFVNDEDGGQAVGTEFPNGVDRYDQLTFNLLRGRTANRYGYDFLGLSEVNDQSIEGYFPDANGNRSNTNLAPYQPTYYAGYIQNKIEFSDLVIQLGLRTDVFDNNTDVLRDIYAPTPILRAGALDARPAGVESDYAVYFQGNNVVGYRDLDGNFYDTQGSRTSSESVLQVRRGAVREVEAPISSVFERYSPQVTVMPRVGVSFPVTDRALFFASFNVTSQRPTEQAFAPISFYEELDGQQSRVPNPRLRPERTTQYELGFRQRLGERAAVSISGFYRTQENKISNRSLIGGFPAYGTYLNADFTTTQGAEVNFDLRRFRNLQVAANYTLSFAQGTGSDAGATANIVWRGNYFPQFLNPADFDQRHTANITLDYRLGEGEGPMVGNVRLFENFGVNVLGQFGSGQRYTRLERNTGFSITDSFSEDVSGFINGSTLPATGRIDMRIDRAFSLGVMESRLRAYVQVQNLLDTVNRLAVFRSTGQTGQDGYLDTEAGQGVLNSPGLVFNYLSYIGGPINVGGNQSSGSGFNYGAPRQVRLGFLLDF